MPKKEKKFTPEEIRAMIAILPPSDQIQLFAYLKNHLDEKEAERKQLSSDYQKLNGKQ